MHVVATAGHVDHGKSTLVKALTGTEPDRLEEERRRGLTIELGYAWTTLPGPDGATEQEVAFVDVPGHERFLRTMLSGVGPVPAALLVVAADDPWMPQAAEHLAALAALGVEHAVVAVSRTDLTDPSATAARARTEIDRTPMRGAAVVPVSAVTGAGLDDLRRAIASMVASLPAPDSAADVRLWVDRSFHVRGAGTVVTGTLASGMVRVGDRLSAGDHAGPVRVRGLQALGTDRETVSGVARVALNIVADDRADVSRHAVLVTPGAWLFTGAVDVRLSPAGHDALEAPPPERSVLHVGTLDVPVRVRPFDDRHVRLTLDHPVPLRIGDRAVLRDPGSRRMWGVGVLDPAPPRLRRRGSGRRRAELLGAHPGVPELSGEVRRRGVVHADRLRMLGVAVGPGAGWLVDEAAGDALRRRMREVVDRHDAEHPLDPGMPVPALTRVLALPDLQVTLDLVAPPLRVTGGRVTASTPDRGLPADLERSLSALASDLSDAPFGAPTADRMRELGLDRRSVGAAARAGRLIDLGDGIVLLPDAPARAVEELAELAQPFTTSEARQRLGSTRRVVLPLLAHLDRTGLTRRHDDDRREVV
ncbi:selenocysteine-specific translation elongation factor [Nocardioides seonyuensis]|uniref:Selenocysteine-specific translation elongation factor n=1 Tax=Nocardioides seonyuensis TaxID=2518371 RepID=A0A4P7ID19_9ACTN|nr:selenocysteine-specific translation elongation factor [Nocardioides seonyuensis]QBX55019.1 selenocysteine-specific translation elongation factor [Nocardioides seonyuensis]